MGEAKKRKNEITMLKIEQSEKYEQMKKLFEENFSTVCNSDISKMKKLGQFFTPFELAWKMTDKFGRSALKDPCKTNLDPTCGYGNLLIVLMMRKISEGADPTLTFVNTYGNELDPETLEICKKNIEKFGKLFGISDNIIKFVVSTHYHVGNALEDKSYEFMKDTLDYCCKHMDEISVLIDQNDGCIYGIADNKMI